MAPERLEPERMAPEKWRPEIMARVGKLGAKNQKY